MATSAFKSTTKRTPIAADESASSSRTSSAHRRSRSLSRFSHRISSPAAEGFPDDGPPPRGRFVNTVRGSGFPEISLDDLAVEFFGSGESSGDRGRSVSRSSGTGPARSGGGDGGSSVVQRRGRSVSRHGGGGGGDGKGSVSNGGGKLVSNNGDNSRRRRSVSAVRYQISDSEQSDIDHSQKRNSVNPKGFANETNEANPSHKTKASNHRQGLRRSFSQKDLRPCDDHSSQSSILTDDEGKDFRSSKFGKERTIRAVYAQNKAQHPTEDDVNGNIYEAMRTELRHAVAEIRTEFEHARGENKPAVSSIMRNYSTKLEESEKRKQDLLSEIMLEEQRRRELSMIVKEFLPDPKDNIVNDVPSRAGPRRSSDRNRMTKRLSEEAEKYIEDFISSIEDTDISSLDGERSDTSSSIGGIMKARSVQSPATPLLPLPVDMDGVSLPWLKWETCNDATPKIDPPTTPKTMLFDSAEEVSNGVRDRVNLSASSHGSCSPGIMDSLPRHIVQDSVIDDSLKAPKFDIEEYLKSRHDEDLLFERFRQQNRIDSGAMVICNSMHF